MRERPNKHFTPRVNWINDPNGLIYHKGFYHLFYQHNPLGNKWGHMSWGHARSKDLFNWEHLPVAIPEQAEHMIFSGSTVFDEANNRIAAFYTAFKKGNQSQWVCFSHDEGITFGEHQKVLDLNLEEFRDPKVFKYKDKWIMVAVKSKLHLISLFESTDLINWTALSDYKMPGVEILYECPDLFELDGKWVMFLSTNPGGPAGGSGMYYTIGNFDGKSFKEDSPTEFLDYGPDYYAAVTFNDAPERISIGWMNNWEYANELARETWNGSMNTPRKLEIQNGKLIQTFIGETKSYSVNTDENFQFKYTNGAITFKREGGNLIVNRSALWDSKLQEFSVPVSGHLEIEAIFDVESIELAINGKYVSAQLNVGSEEPLFERI